MVLVKNIEELKEKVINLFEKRVERKGKRKIISLLKKSDYFEAPASRNHHLNIKGGLLIHSDNVYENYLEMRKRLGLGFGNSKSDLEIPLESVIIESYLHDICKVFKYRKCMKNKWTDGTKDYLISLIEQNPIKVAEDGFSLEVDEEGNYVDIPQEYASDLINYFKYDNKELPDKDDYEEEWGYKYKDDILPVGHGEKSVIMIQQYMKLKKREILAIRWHMGAYEEGVYGGNKSYIYNEAKDIFPDVNLLNIADMKASFEEDWDLY